MKPLIRITLLVLTLFMLDTLTTAPEAQAASVILKTDEPKACTYTRCSQLLTRRLSDGTAFAVHYKGCPIRRM